jgi:hypothetical protein
VCFSLSPRSLAARPSPSDPPECACVRVQAETIPPVAQCTHSQCQTIGLCYVPGVDDKVDVLDVKQCELAKVADEPCVCTMRETSQTTCLLYSSHPRMLHLYRQFYPCYHGLSSPLRETTRAPAKFAQHRYTTLVELEAG